MSFENYKIVACVPSGRRKYLEILLPYLQRCTVIDEIRLWINTKNNDDLDWISLQKDVILVNPPNDNLNSCGVARFYQTTCEENTVYIKIDDDIVFVEDGAIAELVGYRVRNPEPLIVLPNVVNDHIATKKRAEYLETLAQKGNKVANEILNRGNGAEKWHEILLDCWANDALDSLRFPSTRVLDDYCVINVIAYFGHDMAQLGPDIFKGDRNDEHLLGDYLPKIMGRHNLVVGGKLFAHYAYMGPQRAELDKTNILQQYRQVAKDSKKILGAHVITHDIGLAVIKEAGPELLLEEERFNRKKKADGVGHSSNFTTEGKRLPIQGYKRINNTKYSKVAHCNSVPLTRLSENCSLRLFIENTRELAEQENMYGHHACHAASAYYPSGFDLAYVLTSDHAGDDNLSITLSIQQGHNITPVWQHRCRHLGPEWVQEVEEPDRDSYNTMGFWYTRTSHRMGLGSEGALMALSAYGTKILTGELFSWENNELIPNTDVLKEFMSYTAAAHTEEEQANVAHTIQTYFELRHLDILTLCADQSIRNLCFAGGCAMSCQLVNKIRQTGRWDNIFVPPAASDCGLALGAACLALEDPSKFRMPHASWGTSYSQGEVRQKLTELELNYWEASPAEIAKLLIDGKIIAIFDGRSEFGPRALGNRTITADPRTIISRDRLNEIKKRQHFRPVAPAVLDREGHNWFEGYVYSPFMTEAFPVKEAQKSKVPAILHHNGTARLQSIREHPRRFKEVLEEFNNLTDIPMLCNTSFNVQEPIIESIDNAVNTFKNNNIDGLWIEGLLILK